MALKSTIYKAELQVADLDRHHYATYPLTLARHPSETEARLMLRLLAFALFADEALAFGRGISDTDEPDLWQRDLTGAIVRWVDLGLPDERRIARAAGRAEAVEVLAYGPCKPWWTPLRNRIGRLANVRIWHIADTDVDALSALASRGLRLQATLQDGDVMVTCEAGTVSITPRRLTIDD